MSTNIAALVTANLDVWATAIERKSAAGRGNAKKFSLYGIERLRALILDLAVQGRLVPQHAADEPAANLLKDIRQQQAQLSKAGKTGKARRFPPPSEKPPFNIPSNWEWVQIAEIGHDWGQKEPDGDFTYIDVGAIDQASGIIRSPTALSAKGAPSRARKIVRSGTVIYSTVRPYLLNIAIVDQAFEPAPIASTAFAVIHPFDGIEARFIYRYLRSPAFIRYVEGCQTGIAYPAINDRQFFSAWFPLPPAAEQKRIVAKVDELMALCDALEEQSASALEAHQTLVETLLATLVNRTDAANWKRLETHFDTLFTTEASIDALKQAVLDLAVRGKLVTQNKADEPASPLLSRIAEEISAYSAEHRIPRVRPEPIAKAGLSFDLPTGWAWSRLSSLFKVITDGDHQPPPKADQGVAFLTIGNITTGKLNFDGCRTVPEKYYESISEYRKPEKGDILYTVVGATYGRPALVDTEQRFCVQRHIAILKPSISMELRFLEILLGSPLIYEQASRAAIGTAQPTIALRPLRNFLAPVPPFAEQRRIVAKVDELMALCDALKTHITDAVVTQRDLADSIVEKAAV